MPRYTRGHAPNAGVEFFYHLTHWMQNLADPNKKVEDTMMGFMGVVVQTMIQAIGSVFVPYVGTQSVQIFSHFAGEAFKRFAREAYSEDKIPTWAPSFEMMQEFRRQREAEARAAEAAAPAESRPRHRRNLSV
jgi:hypothetical protein